MNPTKLEKLAQGLLEQLDLGEIKNREWNGVDYCLVFEKYEIIFVVQEDMIDVNLYEIERNITMTTLMLIQPELCTDEPYQIPKLENW